MLARLQTGFNKYPSQFWLLFGGMFISVLGMSMIWPFLMIYVKGKLDLPMTQVASLMTVNAIAALIFSFYVNGASFLAYAVVAEKHGLSTKARGVKSIYFTTGLAEASETYVVFGIFCLWPAWFVPVAWVFAVICLYTALSRIVQARADFPTSRHRPESA